MKKVFYDEHNYAYSVYCDDPYDDSYDDINSVNEALMIIEDIDKIDITEEKAFFDTIIGCVLSSEEEHQELLERLMERNEEEDKIVELFNIAERNTSSRLDSLKFKNYEKFLRKAIEVRDVLLCIYIDETLASMVSSKYWDRFWELLEDAYKSSNCLEPDGYLPFENLSREVWAYDCVIADRARMILRNAI